MRGDHGTAREIGEQLLALAKDQQDPTFLVEAYWSLSGVLFHLGELVLVHEYLDQAITIYESQGDCSQTIRHGTIPGIHCLGWLSLTLWIRGYPDQSLQRSHQALTLARQQTAPFALNFVLLQTAVLHQYRGEWSLTQEYAESSHALRMVEGTLQTRRSALEGWVLVMQGQSEQGINLICQWLNEPGYGQSRPYILVLLSSDNATEAETCFQKALSVVRSQQAKSWELRAATSLSRLWQQQGKREEARQLLSEIYRWFTEGFDTADLQDAKALLNELEEGG